MRTAKTRMRSAFGRGGFLASAGALAALTASIVAFSADIALAQNAECARLQQAIAARRGSSGSQGAVERQRAELGRTRAYAGSLGCGNRKFLFFGSEPPPQCSEVTAQISRMEANLADLQARAGGGAGDLVARYNAECGHAQPSGPGNVFEALFGGLARLGSQPEEQPQTDARFEDRGGEEQRNGQPGQPGEKGPVQAHSGSYAVCVRTCDGSFFPVSYSGAGSRADSLEDVCRSLCPNADMALYSFPFGGTIEEAASPTGEPYANLPNAGKFEKAYDASCSCRRKGQTWAEALADAEARYGHEKHDILVTPEKSAEMARPIIDPKAKLTIDSKGKPIVPNASLLAGPGATPVLGPVPGAGANPGAPSLDTATAPVLDANGADTKLSAAAATVSREGSGIAGDDLQSAKSFNVNQGRMVEVTGSDGVKHSVRIVGPSL
jgi:hypothetical protein